jgi:hypothetical protein
MFSTQHFGQIRLSLAFVRLFVGALVRPLGIGDGRFYWRHAFGLLR